MIELFAQTNVPWPVSSQWLLGFIGVSVGAGSVLFTYNQARKAFGRKPPLEQEIAAGHTTVRKQIYAVENNLRREFQQRHVEAERRITMLEERYTEIEADKLRTWQKLQEEISEVRETLGFIRGKLEGES